jgi:hypothetical protein
MYIYASVTFGVNIRFCREQRGHVGLVTKDAVALCRSSSRQLTVSTAGLSPLAVTSLYGHCLSAGEVG